MGLRLRFTTIAEAGKPGVLVKPEWEGESKMAVHSNVLRKLFWQTGWPGYEPGTHNAAGPSTGHSESPGTDGQ